MKHFSGHSFEVDDEFHSFDCLNQKMILSKSETHRNSSTKKNLNTGDADLENIGSHSQSDVDQTKIQPLKGFICMFLSVVGMTLYHFFAKLATFRNSNLNNNDCVLFVGAINFAVFALLTTKDRISLNPFLFRDYFWPFCMSLLCALGINNLMILGVSLIPIGKAVLIFDINPIFCIILAGIILKESIEKVYIISACGSLIGIYLLTMKDEPNNSKSSPVFGTIIVVCAAIFQGLVFITVRILGAARIHYTLRPCYAGLTLLIYSIIVQGGIKAYTYEDIFLMSLSGLSCAMCLGFQTLAFSYQLASKLAPMIYIENIFTILADVVIFGYNFGKTDLLGIVIISCFIALPFLTRCLK
ncbi:unnamed protein product [Moneuplotes crassus]|uniref:EamA domain-containing protein n=1 Tax=Euplotes crassus TaxID=5936 RepID=A0AAD1XIP6_EUPCR|nr:unnamed protein product [Moneuplotes crassus]